MKKLLSAFLVIAALLCAVTVFSSAEEDEVFSFRPDGSGWEPFIYETNAPVNGTQYFCDGGTHVTLRYTGDFASARKVTFRCGAWGRLLLSVSSDNVNWNDVFAAEDIMDIQTLELDLTNAFDRTRGELYIRFAHSGYVYNSDSSAAYLIDGANGSCGGSLLFYEDAVLTLRHGVRDDVVPMFDFDTDMIGAPVNDEIVIDGSGACLHTFGNYDNVAIMNWKLDTPVDVSRCDYVEFYFYVSDVALFDMMGEGQIELTSSGNCDFEETSWRVDSLKNCVVGEPADGWNLIRLDPRSAPVNGCDWSRVNYFRFYFLGCNELFEGKQIGFDMMYALGEDAESPEPRYSEYPYSKGLSILSDGYGNLVLTDIGSCTDTDIVIPYGVTSIGQAAFSGCQHMTSVMIPDSVTSIGNGAFAYCTGLTSITIPDSVTDFGWNVFSGCTGLTSLPDGLTQITPYMFSNCTGLTSATIPDGVTVIGSRAFDCCSGLTSVTIPDSVTSIGYDAFSNCWSLKDVFITDLGAWMNISFGNYSSSPAYYGVNLYLNGKLLTNVTIPAGVTSIGNAFRGCTSLTSVTIPAGVTGIGDYAFSGCMGLASITIPAGVTSIGNYAFSGCRGLTSITIPESVTSIGWNVFSGCTGLTSVTIPDGMTSIGDSMFSGCTGLTSVTIPAGVTSIGRGAFSDCTGLTSITIPDSVTSIGYEAFSDCTGLTSITIPAGVTSIKSFAFSDCTGLTSVTIPDSVTSIGWGAFSGCTGLTSITIPDSVTSIGSHAFEECTGLTSVTIPAGVTSIEYRAFSGCTVLTAVTYGGTKAEWNGSSVDSSSFTDCPAARVIICTDGAMDTEGAPVVPGSFGILTHPVDAAGYEDEKAVFSVTAEGEGLLYCWQYRAPGEEWYDIDLPGSDLDTLSLVFYPGLDGVLFRCKVTDRFGRTEVSRAAEMTVNCRASFTLEFRPADVTAKIGETAAFSVSASGSGLTYQWQSRTAGGDWTDYTGTDAKTRKILVPASFAYHGTQFRCVIEDEFGDTIITAPANLSVTFITVTLQPADIQTRPGSAAFTVRAEGDGLTYQWYYSKNGGQTWVKPTAASSKTAAYTVNAREEINGYLYRCVITDRYGNQVTTDQALLTVGAPLSITAQPTDLRTAAGSVTFAVQAEGDGLTYQWYYSKDGGQTWVKPTAASSKTAAYKINARKEISGYLYRCVVTDGSGRQLTSEAALLTVITELKITAQTDEITTRPGSVVFSVNAEGDELKYQWYYSKDGGETWIKATAASAKTAEYTVNARSNLDGYLYYCVITDASGDQIMTKPARLTIYNGPKITVQPADILTAPGSVNFSVQAEGIGLTYQWYYSKNGGETWVKATAASAKTTDYAVSARKDISGYLYRCTVTDSYSLTVTTDAAALTVRNDSRGLEFADNGDGTCTLTGMGTCTDTVVMIPSEYGQMKVTAIGEYAFFECSGLTAVTIPDGVTSIGTRAFYGCTGLTSVTIPDSVVTILPGAFEGCTGLTSVRLPDSLTRIDQRTFRGCTRLTSVTIPYGVMHIDGQAFEGCTRLASVTIPDSVMTLGNCVFGGCTALTSVTIPDSVTSMGQFAFCGCTGLTSVTIPYYLETLEDYVFCDCTGLKEIVLPLYVLNVGRYTFYGCTGLTDVTLSGYLVTIGDYAFCGCTGLTSISIPHGVVSIGESAFEGCTGLTDVNIPSPRDLLGYRAFANCTGLKTVLLEKDDWVGEENVRSDVFYGCDHLESLVINAKIYSASDIYETEAIARKLVPDHMEIVQIEEMIDPHPTTG